MRGLTRVRVLLLLIPGLGGCASLPENAVSAPVVQLRDVRIVGLGFEKQSFLLSFDVENTNVFSLPVRSINYALRLDGQHFASGETASEFTVPANGNSNFAISVELNLLQTSPQLLSIVRDAAQDDIHYELAGKFGLAIPLLPSLKYRNEGMIRLRANAL